jgi:putative DNA methylase
MTTHPIVTPKKLIEVALQKPAVKGAITRKRSELFKLISELVLWDNSNNEAVLGRARAVIQASWRETCEANADHPDPDVRKLFDPERLPPFHDPFAGGGSIPLEAQRLGLESHATDLNPVAVLINKAMIEIPPKFAGRPPVGPVPKWEKQTRAKATEDWSGARGLAEDVRRYGAWMREEAEKRIGHLYPKVEVTKAMAKDRPDLKPLIGHLTVIAWLWARTVRSPNPAYSEVEVPLIANFIVMSKPGKEVWVEPVLQKRGYRFEVHVGKPPGGAEEGTKIGRGAFRCVMSGSPVTPEHIKAEANAGRMGTRLMAIVAEGERGRVYLSPSAEAEMLAKSAAPSWIPTAELPPDARAFTPILYGLRTYGLLFTARQLVTLITFSDLVQEAISRVRADAVRAGMPDDNVRLDNGGLGARAHADVVAMYLAFVVSNMADDLSTIVTWRASHGTGATRGTFARQALPMTWDFAEANPLAGAAGDPVSAAKTTALMIANLGLGPVGVAAQADASVGSRFRAVISTDPPYFDNVGYADLSDFFYVWLRRSLKPVFPDLFATLTVPKAEELVATPYRHGGKEAAEAFFLKGMTQAMKNIAERTHPGMPVTIYYAFKQSDTTETDGTASTGWETFLKAVLDAGLGVTGTWPMRTERDARTRGIGSNALASSIVLVCRPRLSTASSVARKDFLRQLDRAVPTALADMTADPIAAVAPVDLAQAAIGPGMAIFSRYEAVLEADGSPMSVHSALVHINKSIDDYFSQAEGDLDADTRFCIGWFQQYGFETGAFGEADVLARAKGTSVDGVRDAGVLSSSKGKVRLLKVKEYPKNWDPTTDDRTPIWEACHQMSRALGESEHDAGALLARMPDKQDPIRQLAYRLYTLCERKGWADEARAYNELVTSWPAIVEESHKTGPKAAQLDFLGGDR